MNSIRRLVCVMVCFMLITQMLTACSNNDMDTNNNDGTGTVNSKESGISEDSGTEIDYSEMEKVVFDVWLYAVSYDHYASYSDNPVVQYLNHKFNIKLDFTQPAAGSEQEQLSLMLGSGEYSDMFEISYLTESVESLYEDGVIIDLSDLVVEYMPNLYALLEENEGFRKYAYNDDERLLSLPMFLTEEQDMWGGMVYRMDILETMTGGNVVFPSGNENPVTLEDWDYMLPLFKQYFEAAGLAEYAAFILPYDGIFPTGELISGFGVGPGCYLDGDTVKYGPLEEGYYNYVMKMKEWYDAGYIYSDFASRTNDVYYFPNSALTYGGSAGSWFGLKAQVGDVMSMPEYNLVMDVRAAASPIDTENGVTEANMRVTNSRISRGGYAISKDCENVERLLTALDYLYDPENAFMLGVGLTAEQAEEAGITLYADVGLTDGAYWIEESGKAVRNDLLNEGGALAASAEEYMSNRLPSLRDVSVDKAYASDIITEASDIWATFDNSASLPEGQSLTAEETKIYTSVYGKVSDYITSMIPKFITGTEELNEESWGAFKQQLIDYGVKDMVEISQASVERFNAR